MVGGVVEAGEAEIGLARRLLVAVEQHLPVAALARLAEVARLLAAGDERGAVGIGAVLHGNGAVVFLDAPLHLGKQRLLQRLRVGHGRLLVGVLGLQMGADLRVKNGGIAEHRLPVIVAQPGIVVRSGDAVARVGHGLFRRDGRGGQVLED